MAIEKARHCLARRNVPRLCRHFGRALLDTMANRPGVRSNHSIGEMGMGTIKVVALVGACTVLGALAGYNFAIVREHDYLERN